MPSSASSPLPCECIRSVGHCPEPWAGPPWVRGVRAQGELRNNSRDGRALVEAFIRDRFQESFGSQVRTFMPTLMSLRDATGEIQGAFGLRAATEPLFLEQYIDRPIEAEIALRTGIACERADVVEVGHLSGSFAGVVRTMIGLLTRHLHDEGVRWVTFTGTRAVRNAFERMGLSPVEIGPAERDRLPAAERAAWGRYYDGMPFVFIGSVAEGRRRLHASRCNGTLS